MASLPAPVHPSRSQGQRVQTADVVYMFRKERKEILSGEGNLCDVVEFLAEIYEQIRTMGVKKYLADFQPIQAYT